MKMTVATDASSFQLKLAQLLTTNVSCYIRHMGCFRANEAMNQRILPSTIISYEIESLIDSLCTHEIECL